MTLLRATLPRKDTYASRWVSSCVPGAPVTTMPSTDEAVGKIHRAINEAWRAQRKAELSGHSLTANELMRRINALLDCLPR